MYFKEFGVIKYAQDGYNKNAQNILKAVLEKYNNVDKRFLFQKYLVTSGQRPESVSKEIYGEARFYWTILVINDIINPYLDWALSDEEVEMLAIKKYGKDHLYDIHHFYWLETEKWLDEFDEAIERGKYPENGNGVIPVTNFQYEVTRNFEKKQIILINPRYLNDFVEKYEKALVGGDD